MPPLRVKKSVCLIIGHAMLASDEGDSWSSILSCPAPRDKPARRPFD